MGTLEVEFILMQWLDSNLASMSGEQVKQFDK